MLHFLLPSPHLTAGVVSSRVSSLLHFPRYFLPLPSDIAVAKWIHQHYHVILNVARAVREEGEREVVHFSSYCQTSPIFVNILHLVCGVRIGYEVISCAALTYYVSFLTFASTQTKEEKSTSNGNSMKQVPVKIII